MIRRLLHYCSPRARRLVIAELTFVVIAALLQGIAFLLLVPLMRSLFVGDLTERGRGCSPSWELRSAMWSRRGSPARSA